MKRALVRILYGEPNNPKHDFNNSRSQVDKDILNCLANEKSSEFVAYCFGKYNYDFLKQAGCKKIVLASDNPWIDGEVPFSFMNKIHGFKYAMEDYDEVVFLDWDTSQVRGLPTDFWEVLGKKEVVQAPLVMYPTKKAILPWRRFRPDKANRIVSNSSFLYMRDKSIPCKLLKMKEDLDLNKNIYTYGKLKDYNINATKQWNDEVYLSRYMDDICGGWDGVWKYFYLFEPKWSKARWSCFKNTKSEICFNHG